MRSLPVKALFDGIESVKYPESFNASISVVPTPLCHGTDRGSLIYITEKVGKEDTDIDLSMLSADTAAAAVISNSARVSTCHVPIIRVDSVRSALSIAMSRACGIDYDKMKIIGVTGTNGKTTTATLIYEILRQCGYKVGFIGTGKILSCNEVLSTDSYSMTTPDPSVLYPALEQMSGDGCEYVVMEVSSHSIALGKIEPIRFEYAIFTNLDNDHLDFHGSKEEYFNTKLKLFNKAKTGLFNADDEYGRRCPEKAKCTVTSFGIIYPSDVYATDIELKSLCESSFFYRQDGLIFKAVTRLGGAFNVYNALAAIRCVIDLGIKPCIIKRVLCDIEGVDGRLEVIDGKVKTIIDYAHTPSAFYNCLKTIKSSISIKQKLIVVFGCGGDRDKSKRADFGKYAEMLADIIIITEDNSRTEDFSSIASDITGGISSKDFTLIKDREKAIRHAFSIAREGDVIALIGKGHERYKIIGSEYLPFDERQIIRDAMKDFGGKNES